MKLEQVSIADLKHPEKNVRKHPEPQVREIARSVEMFGQTRPVVIDEDGLILAGNGLVLAFKHLDRDKVHVLQKNGLTDKRKKKLMLADNKTYSLGHDDPEAQYDILKEIIGEDLDFEVPGFDPDVLSSLVADNQQVDDIVNSYGKEIEKQPEKDKKSFFEQNQNQNEDPGKEGPEIVDNRKEARCPHCGEVIWV